MHYLLYLIGVALLALPAGPLIRRRFGLATVQEITERQRYRLGWVHYFNAIDLVRAYAGMELVIFAFASIAPGSTGMLITKLVLCAAALIGLLMQHLFHTSTEESLPAPVAYAVGLAAAILPPHILLLALPLGITASIALRNLGVGLILAAIATGILGKLFGQSLFYVGTVSLLFFAPALLAGMFQRRLVLTVRRRTINVAPMREVRIATTA